MKKLTKAIALAGIVTGGLMGVQAAQAEVSASASVATEYLWRGMTLGNGDAAVSGSLDYAHESGLYAGTWVSSGDASSTEYDLYAGFAGEAGDFGYDLGYATYLYPMADADAIDESAEFYLGLSFKVASLYVYKSSDFDVDGLYAVLGADVSDSVSVALGASMDQGNDYTHLDVTYAFNDQIAFTVSQIVDQELEAGEEGFADDNTKLVMSYTLPIDM
ncbi:MAG: TorF family putative porin [Thalassolituus sp.]